MYFWHKQHGFQIPSDISQYFCDPPACASSLHDGTSTLARKENRNQAVTEKRLVSSPLCSVSPWSGRECDLEGRPRGKTFGRRSRKCTSYHRESTDACSCYSCKRTPVHTNTHVSLMKDLYTRTYLTRCPECHYPLLQCRELTLPQMGQGDGSFLYLVPSSPLASSSSLFMCFGPVEI